MRRSVRPFGPLAGLFCCGLPSWVKHLEPLPRQRHGVEVQMGCASSVCSTTERSRSPYCCRSHATVASRNRGQSWRCSAGRDTTPAARARPSARSLRPLASWLLSAQSWASFAASAGVQPCSTWGGRGWATWGQASGSRMASAAISRADHLRGWPCCLEPWRAYASMCRNWKPMAAV